jgi:hypothetical protein
LVLFYFEYNNNNMQMSLGWPFIDVPIEEGVSSLWLPPYALLLKHHPTMSNVELASTNPSWTMNPPNQPVMLIATQPIAPGQELFLPYPQHPASSSALSSLFPTIPTLDQYHEADAIILEERITLKAKGKSVNRKREIEVGMGLRMTKNALSKYQPVIAALLPTLTDHLLQYRHPGATSVYQSLNNQTHESMAGYGMCLTDVSNQGVSTKAFEKGDRVLPVPLFVKRKGGTEQTCTDGECPAPNDSCLGRPGTFVLFCPLNSRVVEVTADPNQANAVYEWSPWSAVGTDATAKGLETVLEVRMTIEERALDSVYAYSDTFV